MPSGVLNQITFQILSINIFHFHIELQQRRKNIPFYETKNSPEKLKR
jgi:hypothetical protein